MALVRSVLFNCGPPLPLHQFNHCNCISNYYNNNITNMDIIQRLAHCTSCRVQHWTSDMKSDECQRCGKGDRMVFCVRIKDGSWYELLECDHCDTTTLEDDVFYSDTESSDSSMDTTSDADDEGSDDDSSMSAH